MKPRIMLCNESSILNTGYSTYGKEVLSRLYQTGKYDIAEFGVYVRQDNPDMARLPWKTYGNLPFDHEKEAYNSIATNQFGEFKFNEVCMDFKPHIVFDIRDNWMISHEARSPFRRLFNWVIMPTVDATPQNEEWLSTYSSANGCFTYNDWSGQVLQEESGGRVNYLGSAPSSAADDFRPLPNIDEIKESLGLKDIKIIGTVMRNQRRKLFPDLFKAFRKYLDTTKRKDVMLYCHTTYPDHGWDIPKYLMKYGLSSKVLFTYSCQNCGHSFPSLFNDAISHCMKCGEAAAAMTSPKKGVDNQVLNTIINLFDLYVQLSNSEGLGVPQIEAAAAGVVIMSTDYSAMEDVVRKVNGFPIKVKHLYYELETGCQRAIPDEDHLVSLWVDLLSCDLTELKVLARQGFEKHYNWDETAKKWENYFDTVDVEKHESLWNNPPRIHTPSREAPQNCSNQVFANWLINEVLGEPDRIGGYMHMRLIKDLNYGVTAMGQSGMYYNGMSAAFTQTNHIPFGREEAYNHMVNLCNRFNTWESRRCSTERNGDNA